MDPIRGLLNASVSADYYSVLNVGGRFPLFGLPAGFVTRLGPGLTDFFFTGTYVSNGVRIGLIRIPSMSPPNVTLALQQLDQEIAFFNENRGRSAPVSLNATGSLTLAPMPTAYRKPLMVLADEFSASGGDMFPAIIQDNHRGPIFGMRTMGAGGSVVGFNATAFTESFFRITVSLMNRGTVIQTPDFPPAPYIENIGVRPDIVVDYMTRANLITRGAPYVQAFTTAVVNLVNATATAP